MGLTRFRISPWASITLAVLFAAAAPAENRKSRVFDAQFDRVWTAGVEVAREAFPRTAFPNRRQGTLRFRTGPFKGQGFEVVLHDAGGGKTRVELELRNPHGRHAWRDGERYLTLLGEKIAAGQR